jgi:hypothetical protein
MSLALLGFAPTLQRETSSQAPSVSCPWGGLYERYLDDTLGQCLCPLLINRLALGCQHSGSYELDVGQRPAKSLGSWTPFRFQKIGYTEVLYTQKVLVALSRRKDQNRSIYLGCNRVFFLARRTADFRRNVLEIIRNL